MNVTVYLGAGFGNDPVLKEEVKRLGAWIGDNKDTLVYGGSKSGLMGLLAIECMNHGGKAIGVEPEMFMDRELQLDGLTELIVTKDMTDRKKKMIELGDAYIAFPGGTGTLEEISEVMSLVSLRKTKKPCILYNLNGYYDDLKHMLKHMIDLGLSDSERQKGIYFLDTLDEIKKLIKGE